MGAVAAFGVSCVAAGLPRLGWPTFFEEPAMLMGVVLLGKTLEERAKLAASSDMASLQVMPSNIHPQHRPQRHTTHHSQHQHSKASAAHGRGIVTLQHPAVSEMLGWWIGIKQSSTNATCHVIAMSSFSPDLSVVLIRPL